MTHEELEAIRQRAAAAAAYCAARDPAHVDKVRHTPWNYPVAASAIDVSALLAYIDALHGVVHDLRQEPGWELGRQEERRDVLELLVSNEAAWQNGATRALDSGLPAVASASRHTADGFRLATILVRARGPVAPHLAPDDLRRENEALRAALTAVADAYRSEDALTRWSRVTAAIRAAVPLLGEDV